MPLAAAPHLGYSSLTTDLSLDMHLQHADGAKAVVSAGGMHAATALMVSCCSPTLGVPGPSQLLQLSQPSLAASQPVASGSGSHQLVVEREHILGHLEVGRCNRAVSCLHR